MIHPFVRVDTWREKAVKELDGKVWHNDDGEWVVKKKIKNGTTIWARVEKCQNSNGNNSKNLDTI